MCVGCENRRARQWKTKQHSCNCEEPNTVKKVRIPDAAGTTSLDGNIAFFAVESFASTAASNSVCSRSETNFRDTANPFTTGCHNKIDGDEEGEEEDRDESVTELTTAIFFANFESVC